MRTLPKIGERVVVHGMTHVETYVSRIEYVQTEGRHMIHLDWGEHGTSRVFDTDEGKVWYRYTESN